MLMAVLTYILVFGAGVFYIVRLILKGPERAPEDKAYGTHGLEKPPIVTDMITDAGGHHV